LVVGSNPTGPSTQSPQNKAVTKTGEREQIIDILRLSVEFPDGKILWDCVLPSPPVFNGLVAANARLYVVMRDGSLACFGK